MLREVSYKIPFYNFILVIIVSMEHIGFGGDYMPVNGVDAALFWGRVGVRTVRDSDVLIYDHFRVLNVL
jgi:hypothetical protein